ncbi:MAG: M48 family metallopeptidase [Ignavibacteriaceae bacterium]|nr:M48 family metallopeptidase [Ignavibacteriaceae bacterium]
MTRAFQYGSKTIDYILSYTNRKTLGITVTPELEVLIKAPLKANQEKINQILHKRAPWILKQQTFFMAYFPKQAPKKYVSGETFLYLGRQYRLKVLKGKRDSVKLHGRFLTVTCKEKREAKKLLEKWYLEHAVAKFTEYCDEWVERFSKYNVKPKEVLVKHMPKRWGSCTAKGRIILNSELIKAPKGCIEYVIVHELCHLVHFGHNTKFLEVQNKMLPSWEKWKDRLERVMA